MRFLKKESLLHLLWLLIGGTLAVYLDVVEAEGLTAVLTAVWTITHFDNLSSNASMGFQKPWLFSAVGKFSLTASFQLVIVMKQS